jgi:hypothetical protein
MKQELKHKKMRERQLAARQLRIDGKTFKEIGEHFGFSGCRARQLVRAADRYLKNEIYRWDHGLTSRAKHCLRASGIMTFEDAVEYNKLNSFSSIEGIGLESELEIENYLNELISK